MANLSYAQGPSASLWDLTLSEVLSQTASRFPDRDGLISRHQNIRLSWRELDENVTRVARGLTGLGLQPGDRIGVWAGNCIEWILLQYACARAGFVQVNVNPAYRAHELAYILQRSGMKALFLRYSDARANYQEILDAARSPEQALTHVIHLGTCEWDAMLASGCDLLVLTLLQGVTQKLAAMPGQRTVILVSPGFLVVENLQAESKVVEHALASNITISSLDARGLYARDPAGDIGRKKSASAATLAYENQLTEDSATSQSQVLSELASATGGIFFHNNNDLEEGFRRTVVGPEYYYLLGFVPQQLKYDGKYHVLRVALKGGLHYTLQARNGYYAPNHQLSTAEQAKGDIEDAVFSQEERLEVPVELNTQFFKASDEDAKLAVLVRIDVRGLRYQKVNGLSVDDLTVVSAVFDRNGNFLQGDQKTVKMRLTDDTLKHKLDKGVTLRAKFDVKPGTYQVRCVVRDNEGKLSARNLAVDIP